MKKIHVGDIVVISDGSFSFGIYDGKYSEGVSYHAEVKGSNLTVISDGLSVKSFYLHPRESVGVCDLMVTNSKGDFWFVQSDLCQVVSSDHHTIIIDGKAIELSQESFDNLKEQLCE